MVRNLYIHFPFCRRKCAYCALHSRAGRPAAERDAYARAIARDIERLAREGEYVGAGSLATVYLGGGSPALADLSPVFAALAPLLAADAEFTVELHPLDATAETVGCLADRGVNRVSMGVEALDDEILADMGRMYTLAEARAAFARVKAEIPNAGIDLIAGYPDPRGAYRPLAPEIAALKDWGLAHASVYSLILEEHTILAKRCERGLALPGDDETLDDIRAAADALASLGLERYEISNYALKGMECRHNLATWRGEDYLGLGEGAAGRIALTRTLGTAEGVETTEVDPETDRKERALFRLRTREGIDTATWPQWRKPLDAFTAEGLLEKDGFIYRLTRRGSEVCDSILAELV